MGSELEKKRDTKFQKGQSGNPRGRPKGSKNKATLLREAMQNKVDLALSRDVPKVLKVVVRAALDGDMSAAKMILDRAVPVRKAQDGSDEHAPLVNITIKNLTGVDDQPRTVTINGETVQDAEG